MISTVQNRPSLKPFQLRKDTAVPVFVCLEFFSLKGLNTRNGLMSVFFYSSHPYLKSYLRCPRAPVSPGANDSEALWWCQEGFTGQSLPNKNQNPQAKSKQDAGDSAKSGVHRKQCLVFFSSSGCRTLQGYYCDLLHRAKGHSFGATLLTFSDFTCIWFYLYFHLYLCCQIPNTGIFWSLLFSFFLCNSSTFLLPFRG